jgi:replicative DNA helicase
MAATSRADAERGIVRFLLLKPELAYAVFERVQDPQMFRDTILRGVFDACLSLYRAGDAISQAGIRQIFEQRGAKSTGFLNVLFVDVLDDPEVVSQPILESHAEILVDHFHVERFKEQASTVQTFEDAVGLSRKALDWDSGINLDTAETPEEITSQIIDKQQAIYAGNVQGGYSWGLPGLDRYLRLTPGGLYLVGGLKKSAKTHFVISVLDGAASMFVPCCLFSLEMTSTNIFRRIIARRTGVDSRMIHSRYLDRADFDKIKLERDNLKSYSLHVDDSAGLAVTDIVSRARRWKYKNQVLDGHGIIAVDFLQLIRMDGERNRTEASLIKHAAFELARLAKDLDVAVIALAQLSNLAERQEPHISMLEGSGGPAQAAEAILLIDLVRRRDPDHVSTGKYEDVNIIVAEQRSGESGRCRPCTVDLKTSTFFDQVNCRQDLLPV